MTTRGSTVPMLAGIIGLWAHSDCAAAEPPGAVEPCIQRVLAEDDRLGRERNRAPEVAPIDEAVRTYVRAIEALDYGGCPQHFIDACSAHAAAWRATLPLLRRHAHRRGEMHALFKAIAADPDGRDLPAYEAVIWKTWAEVERASDQAAK